MISFSTEKPNIFESSEPCYFEANQYGFMQKRISTENVNIPVFDESKGTLVMKHILAPDGEKKYGK